MYLVYKIDSVPINSLNDQGAVVQAGKEERPTLIGAIAGAGSSEQAIEEVGKTPGEYCAVEVDVHTLGLSVE